MKKYFKELAEVFKGPLEFLCVLAIFGLAMVALVIFAPIH
tara:strand:- start:335 stop:454 length:120 start_codon:yes stop_codon:yes gene_type:complete